MEITKSTATSPIGEVTLYRLTNDKGASVELSSLGAGITEVSVPDANGNIENVTLRYADPASYLADGPCAGKTPGRYANRICKGKLQIDGITYDLPINNGPNHLHGGPKGFQNQIWESEETENGVIFRYHSKDGEMGYPGNLTAEVKYTWNDDNELTIDLSAKSDAKTVVNLTNHAYFNLEGADGAEPNPVLGHELKLNASYFLPGDETLIPSGEMAPVDATPMDFSEFKTLGEDIRKDFAPLKYGKGYDHCFCVDGPNGELREACVLRSPKSRRRMTVLTDQPGVQIYTGNYLSGSPANMAGRSYEDYEGVAMEAQGFPDAPSRGAFPSQTVAPDAPYHRTIVYRFDTF
ncbi:MAG: galactose mutarotase [Muribaculaceae bacterium]|nr:galactose mutarotase [Muribaculaceae bacterium]